ncbi:hypothetical protein ACWDV4_11090 [Micromonospora sp. NPDC003197]
MSTSQSAGPTRPTDVERALTTARLHQDSIQHADAKIARLAGMYGVLVSLIVSTLPSRSDLSGTPGIGIVAGLAGVVFISSSVAGARQLVLGFRPVVTGPRRPNRFGFPDYQSPPSIPAVGQESTEAWQLVMLLGQIAHSKHRRVRSALPWTFAAVVSATSWLVLTALL